VDCANPHLTHSQRSAYDLRLPPGGDPGERVKRPTAGSCFDLLQVGAGHLSHQPALAGLLDMTGDGGGM